MFMPPAVYKVTGYKKENWAVIEGAYALSPIFGGDGRVLIEEDGYTSRMDCVSCKGKGHTGEPCKECKGNEHYRGKTSSDDKCTTCNILRDKSQPSNMAAWINLHGMQPCLTCDGTGSSSLVIPDESKKQTTMGNVLAVSERGILCVKVDDKVQYTNYTGTKYEFMGKLLRICVEKDLLCIAKKLKANIDSIAQQGFADLDNVGIAHDDE